MGVKDLQEEPCFSPLLASSGQNNTSLSTGEMWRALEPLRCSFEELGFWKGQGVGSEWWGVGIWALPGTPSDRVGKRERLPNIIPPPLGSLAKCLMHSRCLILRQY